MSKPSRLIIGKKFAKCVIETCLDRLPPVTLGKILEWLIKRYGHVDSTVKQLAYLEFRQESFAQEGEDLLLERIFTGRSSGFYVDVGAHHPVRFSNTYRLYRRGWHGINIDAMPGSMAEFRAVRPRDINIEALVSSTPKPRPFFLFNEPALNTSSEKLAQERGANNCDYKITQRMTITPRSLAAILDEYLPLGQAIDFINVDVEGSDLDVLQSNDWDRYRPLLILVEMLDTDIPDIESNEIGQYLRGKGYSAISKLYNTAFFRRVK